MKVAYLIIAHNQPGLLARLVRALDCEWARFFIHVDAKADLAPFRDLLQRCDNVIFLWGEQRVKVYWGGFSQVQATLNLLEAAEDSDGDFSRYCLLSGSDFPIKPLAAIKEQFASDREFMRIDRRLDMASEVSCRHARAIRRYFFLDLPLPRWIKLHLLSGWIPRSVYPGMPLYHGAQWWSLTGDCGRYLVRFVREYPSYSSFCRHVLAPDEIFFHSIVKHSPFAQSISHDFERAGKLAEFYALNDHGCHYIDWNAQQKVLPKILTSQDLGALRHSKALFARKFDSIQSLELVQILENEVMGSHGNLSTSSGPTS